MIQHGKTLIGEEVLEKSFVCDLNACQGACCVEGDAGAPLLNEELNELDEAWKVVKPYLSEEGVRAIEEQGKYIEDWDGEYVTPLIKGKECAYTVFENGMALCGIEKAFNDGKTNFRKPISCHLYPIRIKSYESFDAVNYDKWSICSAACVLGEQLKVPVFRFAKDALIRKYGQTWYDELEELYRAWNEKE